jgi:hypothetical protein
VNLIDDFILKGARGLDAEILGWEILRRFP